MPDLRGSLLAWEQWKTDVYALAKATLNTPHALAACETLTIVIVRRLQRGCAVRIDGEEVAAALQAPDYGVSYTASCHLLATINVTIQRACGDDGGVGRPRRFRARRTHS
jgi:hypothetical protein